MQIQDIFVSKILNSKKRPTISVAIQFKGKRFESSAPEGTSKGIHEVQTFSSKGIDFSIHLLNAIGKKIVSDKINFETFQDLKKFEEIIKKFDATLNFSVIGGSAVYAFETALLKAMAFSHEQEMWQFLMDKKSNTRIPLPLGKVIGGGMHVEQDLKTDFQEFLIMPRTKNFSDAYSINLQAYKEAKLLLKQKDKYWQETIDYENSLASTLDNESILDLLEQIKDKIKTKFGTTIELGIDIAASDLWNEKKYIYKNFKKNMQKAELDKKQQLIYLHQLTKKYNLFYIEDPFQEDDFSAFSEFNKKTKALVCGDDLTCTSLDRLKKAIKMKSIKAIMIKPNQRGSLIETKETIDFAKKNDIILVASHRSGDTCDNALAHFALGWQIPIIKTGILGKERFAKLNELLRIERKFKF